MDQMTAGLNPIVDRILLGIRLDEHRIKVDQDQFKRLQSRRRMSQRLPGLSKRQIKRACSRARKATRQREREQREKEFLTNRAQIQSKIDEWEDYPQFTSIIEEEIPIRELTASAAEERAEEERRRRIWERLNMEYLPFPLIYGPHLPSYQEELEEVLRRSQQQDLPSSPPPRIIRNIDHGTPELDFVSDKEKHCAICLQDFKDDDLISVLECGHGGHKKCTAKLYTLGYPCSICRHEPSRTPWTVKRRPSSSRKTSLETISEETPPRRRGRSIRRTSPKSPRRRRRRSRGRSRARRKISLKKMRKNRYLYNRLVKFKKKWKKKKLPKKVFWQRARSALPFSITVRCAKSSIT